GFKHEWQPGQRRKRPGGLDRAPDGDRFPGPLRQLDGDDRFQWQLHVQQLAGGHLPGELVVILRRLLTNPNHGRDGRQRHRWHPAERWVRHVHHLGGRRPGRQLQLWRDPVRLRWPVCPLYATETRNPWREKHSLARDFFFMEFPREGSSRTWPPQRS